VTALELLHDAAFNGDSKSVTHLLDGEPSLINMKSKEGDSVLHMACWGKQIGLIGILLDCGADVNGQGWLGRTPLHYSVHEGGAISVPIVHVLLQGGADPNIKDDKGFTPSDWAKIDMEDSPLVEVLKLLQKPIDLKAERLKILKQLEELNRICKIFDNKSDPNDDELDDKV